MIDVGAVHHGVDGERQPSRDDFGGERVLALVCALVAGDVIGRCRLAVLDRDLHVIETGIGELAEALVGDADRRGDQVGVEARVVRGLA